MPLEEIDANSTTGKHTLNHVQFELVVERSIDIKRSKAQTRQEGSECMEASEYILTLYSAARRRHMFTPLAWKRGKST